MPQEPAGCPRARKPALALLMGLALMLLAHVAACAVHSTEGHVHATAASPTEHAGFGSDVHLFTSDASACPALDAIDHHPGHGATCCDPADLPADVRAPAAALLLAVLLLALLQSRHRLDDPTTSGTPPGRGDATRAPCLTGPHLLRFVCVSRT
jgi:hypothetical protein